MIKKTYHISGFDCPNCAHKSEAHLGKHEKVDSCHIDFSTNKMYVTYKEKELEVDEIKEVIAQVESDPLDIYDLDKKVVKKTYHISGFDCPNCAGLFVALSVSPISKVSRPAISTISPGPASSTGFGVRPS